MRKYSPFLKTGLLMYCYCRKNIGFIRRLHLPRRFRLHPAAGRLRPTGTRRPGADHGSRQASPDYPAHPRASPARGNGAGASDFGVGKDARTFRRPGRRQWTTDGKLSAAADRFPHARPSGRPRKLRALRRQPAA